MPAYRRKDNGKWRYRKVVKLPDGGKKRISGSPTVNTKRAAEAAEREHIERVLNPPAAVPEGATVTLAAFVDERFVPDNRRNWKYSERLTTKSLLQRHLIPRLGKLPLADIRGATVATFTAELHREGLGDKSVYNVLTLLRRILRYAERVEVLASVPSFPMPKGVRQARRELVELGISRSEFLSFEELDRLLEVVQSPMLRAMVLVAGRAGLRAGEVRALRWADIDRKRGLVTVSAAEYRGVLGKPKSGCGRRIPLPSRLRDALDRLPRALDPEALIFTSGGRMFTEGEMTTLLLEAGVRAELPTAQGRRRRRNDNQRAYRLRRLTRPLKPDEERWLAEYEQHRSARFGWHTLRHTFCTHLAMTGTPVVKIQRWAGHADLATTQRYMHWAPSTDDVRHIDALDRPSAQVLQLA